MKPVVVFAISLHIALVAILFRFWVGEEFELQWIYPFALLFTGYRAETLKAWEKYGALNTKIIRPPTPIPEILAKGK